MRLTTDLYYGFEYGFTKPCDDLEHLQLVADKLGQLEDIEAMFDIDLIVLFKALRDGVWYRMQNGKLRYMRVALVLSQEGWLLAEFYPKPTNVAIQLYNPMHKYGVGWAFTKEELE